MPRKQQNKDGPQKYVDWKKIESEYITTEETGYRKLATKYNVPFRTLTDRAIRECWYEKKKNYRRKVVAKVVEDVVKDDAQRIKRIVKVSDNAIDLVEDALKEIRRVIVKHKTKTKNIEYDYSLGKPKKEVIKEEEEIEIVDGGIDAFALNQLTLALKNLKDIQMLRTENDRREQEARIKKLEAEASKAAPEQEENNTGVVLLAQILKEEDAIDNEEERFSQETENEDV